MKQAVAPLNITSGSAPEVPVQAVGPPTTEGGDNSSPSFFINPEEKGTMREIEFRAKDNHGKWRHGSYVKFEGLQGAIYYPIYHRVQGDEFKVVRTDWCYADENTVSQYSGVKDKNGREIYEGDILRADYYPYHDDGEDNYLGVVFYADDEKMWQVMKFVTAKSERRGISNFINTAFYDTDFTQMEVIGNVWDSKGLFRDTDEEVMKWFKSE